MREAGHRLAIRGQRHTMGIAHEQPPPGAGLQLADVLADGRLLQSEPPTRFGEVARAGYGEKAFQMDRVEHSVSHFGVGDPCAVAAASARRLLIMKHDDNNAV